MMSEKFHLPRQTATFGSDVSGQLQHDAAPTSTNHYLLCGFNNQLNILWTFCLPLRSKLLTYLAGHLGCYNWISESAMRHLVRILFPLECATLDSAYQVSYLEKRPEFPDVVHMDIILECQWRISFYLFHFQLIIERKENGNQLSFMVTDWVEKKKKALFPSLW